MAEHIWGAAQTIWGPVSLSLKVALLSSLLVFIFGVAAARFMTKAKHIPGRDFIEGLLTLPMVLPPTVLGFGLLFLLGKNGLLGQMLDRLFHVQVVFTWWAGVIASGVVAFPIMYQSAKGALESINANLEKAARTLGAGELKVFLTVSLPLAWPGILGGLVLSFARALGEFGATLMLAGNIPGKTQTIPLAIYSAVESGDFESASWLVGIMIAVAFAAIYWLNLWTRKKIRPQG